MSGILEEKQAAMRARQKRPKTKKRDVGVKDITKFYQKDRVCPKCGKEFYSSRVYCPECVKAAKQWLASEEFINLRKPYGYSGVVYFMQAEIGGPIKIGHTKETYINRRLHDVQTGNPYPLRIIAVIDGYSCQEEKDIHKKFAHLRMCGEWFKDTPELIDFIEKTATRKLIISEN